MRYWVVGKKPEFLYSHIVTYASFHTHPSESGASVRRQATKVVALINLLQAKGVF